MLPGCRHTAVAAQPAAANGHRGCRERLQCCLRASQHRGLIALVLTSLQLTALLRCLLAGDGNDAAGIPPRGACSQAPAVTLRRTSAAGSVLVTNVTLREATAGGTRSDPV